ACVGASHDRAGAACHGVAFAGAASVAERICRSSSGVTRRVGYGSPASGPCCAPGTAGGVGAASTGGDAGGTAAARGADGPDSPGSGTCSRSRTAGPGVYCQGEPTGGGDGST